MPTGILIVDDHPLFVEALEQVIQSTFPATPGGIDRDGARGARQGHPLQPHLLDLSMPDTRGLEGVIELRNSLPETPHCRRFGAG